MAPKTAASADKPARKAKSTGGGPKRKPSAFNMYMKKELARLKEAEPDMSHKERFALATQNWKKDKGKE